MGGVISPETDLPGAVVTDDDNTAVGTNFEDRAPVPDITNYRLFHRWDSVHAMRSASDHSMPSFPG